MWVVQHTVTSCNMLIFLQNRKLRIEGLNKLEGWKYIESRCRHRMDSFARWCSKLLLDRKLTHLKRNSLLAIYKVPTNWRGNFTAKTMIVSINLCKDGICRYISNCSPSRKFSKLIYSTLQINQISRNQPIMYQNELTAVQSDHRRRYVAVISWRCDREHLQPTL